MTSNNGFNPVNLKRILGPEDQVKPVAIKKRKPTPENEVSGRFLYKSSGCD